MSDASFELAMLGTVCVLLLGAIVMMAVIAIQLRGLRREAAEARVLLAKMDWSQMLLNGVQQLKSAVATLDTIDKRLQKLEALEKVQLSHINIRAGR